MILAAIPRVAPESAPVRRPTGRTLSLDEASGAPLPCRIYTPAGSRRPARLLVAVHGIARQHREQTRLWREFADLHGFMVIAPLFDRKRFKGYQRLETGSQGEAPNLTLLRLLTWLEAQGLALPARRILFGHSGGAQFAHRFLLAHPHTFDALIVSSAGWYTWPGDQQRFPAGLRPAMVGSSPVPTLDLEAFLQVPVLVTVGALDTDRDPQVRTHPAIDALQGPHRLERAQRWVAALRHSSTRLGIPTQTRLVTIPRAGHDFADAMACGLASHCASFLQDLPWLWTDAHSR